MLGDIHAWLVFKYSFFYNKRFNLLIKLKVILVLFILFNYGSVYFVEIENFLLKIL